MAKKGKKKQKTTNKFNKNSLSMVDCTYCRLGECATCTKLLQQNFAKWSQGKRRLFLRE